MILSSGKKLVNFFFLGISCGLPLIATASEPTEATVSLEGYLTRALSANPKVDAFRQRYEAALERISQASALPDPMLQVTSFVESVQTRTGPQENVIMLGQKIPWFGKLDTREAAASAEADALWHAFQSQQLSLAKAVSIAYYDYAYLGKAIELTAENVKLLESLEPIVDERVRGGGDLNPLLRLKVEIGKIDDKRQSLEKRRTALAARINELLSLPADDLLPWPTWEAPGSISLDGPSLVTAIRMNNPELSMLKSRVESAEARRELARLQSYPDITFGINYIQIGDPEVNPMTPDASQDAWGVSIALNLPIWLEKNRAGRAEALSAQRAAERDYDDRWNKLRADLSASIALMEDANRRLDLYGDELLGLAEQAVEISRTSYENGRTGILEVIDSERSLLDLQLLYWRAASDAWQQRITIQTLANQPLAGTFKATTSK